MLTTEKYCFLNLVSDIIPPASSNILSGRWQKRIQGVLNSYPEATYACVNYGEAVCPEDISEQSICIDGDIGQVIEELRK